ncbi:MAG: hypothetical protein KF865_13730 [Bdellovibrionaceae bacterium]|nr:hypothetical protein [Pseudobdellovibrionaceae bacterium]
MQNKGRMICGVAILVALSAGANETKKDGEPAQVDLSEVKSAKPAVEESPEAAAARQGLEVVNAAVNVIRKNDRTEVVFRNGDVYYMPSGKNYNSIYKACEESERTGQAISVVVNPRSKVIVSASAGGGSKGSGPK